MVSAAAAPCSAAPLQPSDAWAPPEAAAAPPPEAAVAVAVVNVVDLKKRTMTATTVDVHCFV